jgi:hypothetical protein
MIVTSVTVTSVTVTVHSIDTIAFLRRELGSRSV